MCRKLLAKRIEYDLFRCQVSISDEGLVFLMTYIDIRAKTLQKLLTRLATQLMQKLHLFRIVQGDAPKAEARDKPYAAVQVFV